MDCNNTAKESMNSEKNQQAKKLSECNETLTYGWGRVRPGFLRCINNSKCFLIVIMMYTLGAGVTMNGLLAVVLPSLEKRFSLSSKELGVIAASNDVVALGLAVFIGFYGDYCNKIKWVGGGAVTAGIGVLLFTLPHLVAGRYEVAAFESATTGLCQISRNSTSCDGGSEHHAAMWYYIVMFVIAQLIHGAGICPLYSLVPAYLDENVEPKQMPIYIGLWYMCAFLGPGMGALLGAQFLRVFVDIKQPEGLNLTPTDSRWIGAWWLGFLIFGLLFLIIAMVILGFPSSLPGAKERRGKHIAEGTIRKADSTKEASFKRFAPELKDLFKNVTFSLSTLGITAATMFVSSLLPFLAKILHLKFGLDPVRNATLISAILIPTVIVGTLIGSFIMKHYALKLIWKQFLLCIAICVTLVSILTTGSILIPGCENASIAGVSNSYLQGNTFNSSIRLTDTCNIGCHCTLKQFSPVCGSNNITYLNPCYAGCSSRQPDKTFVNCSCAIGSLNKQLGSERGTAQPGYCDRDCKNAAIFLAIIAMIVLVHFSTATPIQVIILRSVPDNKRSFAMSMQYLLIKGIGLIPGPIIFGHLLDVCCRLWQDICGTKGRCFDYDVDQVSKNIAIFGVVCCGTSAMLFASSWYLYKPNYERSQETGHICNTVISNPTAAFENETNF